MAASLDGSAPETKLFVGGLTRTTTEDDLKAIFDPFGVVSEVFMIKDAATGQKKGCGFVKFDKREDAVASINKLNKNHTIAGSTRPLEVRFAETKKAGVNQQMGMNRAVGGRFNTSIPSIPRPNSKWKEYLTADGRAYYHNEVSGVTQWDRPLEMDYFGQQAVAVSTSGESNGPPGGNIFIFHVPNDWTQNDLINAFSPFGHIISAMISTDKNTGRNRGFAFVSYDDINSAANAVMAMNGYMASNKRLKVTIKRGEEQYVQHLLGASGSPVGNNFPPQQPQIGGSCLPPQMAQFEFGSPGMVPPIAAAAPIVGGQAYAGFGSYASPQGNRYAPY